MTHVSALSDGSAGVPTRRLVSGRAPPCRDTRSTRAVGIDPISPDQVQVPAKQRVGLDEEPAPTLAVEQSTQPGEEGTIRRQGRSG